MKVVLWIGPKDEMDSRASQSSQWYNSYFTVELGEVNSIWDLHPVTEMLIIGDEQVNLPHAWGTCSGADRIMISTIAQ